VHLIDEKAANTRQTVRQMLTVSWVFPLPYSMICPSAQLVAGMFSFHPYLLTPNAAGALFSHAALKAGVAGDTQPA
jgi:hypothetical protein